MIALFQSSPGGNTRNSYNSLILFFLLDSADDPGKVEWEVAKVRTTQEQASQT